MSDMKSLCGFMNGYRQDNKSSISKIKREEAFERKLTYLGSSFYKFKKEFDKIDLKHRILKLCRDNIYGNNYGNLDKCKRYIKNCEKYEELRIVADVVLEQCSKGTPSTLRTKVIEQLNMIANGLELPSKPARVRPMKTTITVCEKRGRC